MSKKIFHNKTSLIPKYCFRLDPNNQRAIEGLNNLSESLSTSKRDSYYTARDESPTFACQASNVSDREPDAESDSDIWSNGDNYGF